MGEGCRSFAAGCAGAGLSRIRSCGRRAARNKQRQGDENAVTRSIERKKENRFVEGGEEENEEEEGAGERTMDEFDSGPRSDEKEKGSTAPHPEKVQIGNSLSELREIYEREGISSRISRSNINDRSGSNALEVAPKFEHRSSEGCNNGQHTNGRFIALLVVFMVFLESITKDAKATIISRLWMCWVLVCGMFGIIILMRTQYAQQSYKVSDTFPFKWINKKWKEGFYVTAMAAAGVRWAVVMSRNAGFSDQAVELDCLYPSEGIHRRWDSSYRITATRNLAAFVLSVLNRKPADETQETLRTSAFPSQHVRKSGQRISTPHLFVTAERFLEAPFSSYDGREEAAKSRLTTTLSSCPSIFRLKAPVKCGS